MYSMVTNSTVCNVQLRKGKKRKEKRRKGMKGKR